MKGYIMGKKEYLQKRLDYIKTFVFTCLVAIFGIIAYVAVHFNEISLMLGILSVIGFVALGIGIYWGNKTFNKYLKKLKDTK